jgi:hypothetical protein
MSRAPRLLFVGAALSILSCSYDKPADPRPPYRAEVLAATEASQPGERPSYQVGEKQFSMLTDLKNMDGRFFNLVFGGELKIDDIVGSQVTRPTFSGGTKPLLRYNMKNGVIVPRDYSTLAMLSAYYQFEQVLGNVNPVAAPYFNFTVTEPMGIIGVIAPDEAPLLALISLIAPAITSGNTVVALASSTQPYPAILLGEMLATSDLPGGVVNLLTGFRKEMISTFATHTHLRAISAVVNAEERKALALGAADSVKRTQLRKAEDKLDWLADSAQSLEAIRETLEFKTTWHPIGA